MAPPRVVVFGGLNFDLIVETPHFAAPGETVEAPAYHEMFGGKGGNQAVGAARMGARVDMVGRIGGDSYGKALVASLKAAGVGVSGVTADRERKTGLAFVFIDQSGENTVTAVYGANAACGVNERDSAIALLEGAAMLLVQQEVSVETTREVMALARAGDVRVMLDPAPARENARDLLSLAEIVTPNETEAEHLTGVSVRDVGGAARAAAELRRAGPTVAIVTLGARGAYIDSDEVSGHFAPFAVTPIASVAAGDAFAAALATCLAEGLGMSDAMVRATASAAISVTRKGAQESMPLRAEVEALVAAHPELATPLHAGSR